MAENSGVKPRTRVNWTATERVEWLTLFTKSGRTAAEFCRDNDLSPATLSFWLRQQQGQATCEEPALVEVSSPTLSISAGPGAPVTAHFPGGLRLEIIVGTDPMWLAHLLRALQNQV